MPVVHVLAGPNASGKTTFWKRVLGPATRLPFINADFIAGAQWPGQELERAYDASRLASQQREEALAQRRSFVTETVFSHRSKLDFVHSASALGYRVVLHVMMVPEELAVVRARLRGEQGGHRVPESKVRDRYRRLWKLVRDAMAIADEAVIYDNSRAATPFVVVARYTRGELVGESKWPSWSPLPTH